MNFRTIFSWRANRFINRVKRDYMDLIYEKKEEVVYKKKKEIDTILTLQILGVFTSGIIYSEEAGGMILLKHKNPISDLYSTATQ
jgi:hypothetical protein